MFTIPNNLYQGCLSVVDRWGSWILGDKQKRSAAHVEEIRIVNIDKIPLENRRLLSLLHSNPILFQDIRGAPCFNVIGLHH